MARKMLTKEQDEYLRAVASGKSVQECADALNTRFGTSFTYDQVKQYKNRHNIRSGKKSWEFVDHSRHKKFNADQEEFIKANAKGIGNAELTDMFNKEFGTSFTVKQIGNYKSRNGINSGLTGHFPKGHVPVNKGKKMSKELYDKAKPTMFKKGDMPHNTRPVGTIEKRSDTYWWKKISEDKIPARRNWKQIHRILWEETNGPIPEGYVIIFKDGNTDNLDLDNLMMVTMQERLLMARHGLFVKDYPELTESGAILAKLMNIINQKKNVKKS